MRLTVGPLPPAVYWRRRAFVLGAVLLALFLVAQACMAAAASPDGQSGAKPGPTGTPAPVGATAPETAPPNLPGLGEPTGAGDTPVDGSEDQPEIPDGDRCTDEEMLITAEADPTAAAAGATIRLTIRIENASDRTCVRDVGPGQRELYLRRGSGANRVWSSRDCVELSGSDRLELSPIYNATHFVDWNGRSTDSCADSQPDGPVLEPGEYELVARLGTIYSEPVTITLS